MLLCTQIKFSLFIFFLLTALTQLSLHHQVQKIRSAINTVDKELKNMMDIKELKVCPQSGSRLV